MANGLGRGCVREHDAVAKLRLDVLAEIRKQGRMPVSWTRIADMAMLSEEVFVAAYKTYAALILSTTTCSSDTRLQYLPRRWILPSLGTTPSLFIPQLA